MPAPRTDLCPVCEQKNACSMAATGDPTRPCWCRTTKIPKGLIDGLPIAEQRTRCICKSCATSYVPSE